jgi:hypothetical protein
LARSERFELPTLGFEVRCSIQLSYERILIYGIEFIGFINITGREDPPISCCVCCHEFPLSFNGCRVLPATPRDTHATWDAVLAWKS